VIDEGEVRGYLIADFENTTAHLSRIAIDPFYHNRGYATALLSDAIEKATRNRVNLMTVNTQESNSASLSFYRKFGFTPTNELIPVYQHSPCNPPG
jgi:ribosomal-protein-alanine N-acetyltransferase